MLLYMKTVVIMATAFGLVYLISFGMVTMFGWYAMDIFKIIDLGPFGISLAFGCMVGDVSQLPQYCIHGTSAATMFALKKFCFNFLFYIGAGALFGWLLKKVFYKKRAQSVGG